MFLHIKNKHILPGNTHCGNTDWGDCKRCRLHLTRNRVAVKRFGGQGHTRILFIGEAPGELENKTGIPFVGTSGKIFEQLIKHTQFQFQYCITNTVGCQTADINFDDLNYEEDFDEFALNPLYKKLDDPEFSLDGLAYEIVIWGRPPTKAEIDLCKPHIDELMESFQPHGVVYLGKVAESYTNPKYLVSTERLLEDTDSKFFKHTQFNEDWVWRQIPTLSLLHPTDIDRLEYKLLPLRKQARKLDLFVERFIG